MDDETIRLLKKISMDIENLRDNLNLVHKRLTGIEKTIEGVNKVYEDVEDVREEINRYFELQNTMR